MKTSFELHSSSALRRPSPALSLAAALALTTGFGLSLSGNASAVQFTLNPAGQTAAVGAPFSLSIDVAGLGDHTAPSLGGFDFNLRFDPALVRFEAITFGDAALGDLLAPVSPSFGDVTPLGAGLLNVFGLSMDLAADLDASQPAGFGLATLSFTALAAGSAGFGVEDLILADGLGDALLADAVTGARVEVRSTAVPDGGAGWAWVAGMGALMVFGRSGGRASVRRVD